MNEKEAPLRTANRLLIAERGKAGSIAAFPPPHNFFIARESSPEPRLQLVSQGYRRHVLLRHPAGRG